MNQEFWLQQSDKPLYPDILWSRPESKQGAGKLLIIGGNKFGFAAPATAFSEATAAGAGTIRILMPEGLHKLVGGMTDAHFAPQNPSGSFSKSALDSMLMHAGWSDAVLLAGELGRNSETAVTLENFAKKYSGPLIITRDAADYFVASPQEVLKRPNTCLVISFEQLQKIGIHTKSEHAITFGMQAAVLAEWLHEFTKTTQSVIVTLHNEMLFVARGGQVATQIYIDDEKIWRVPIAARVSVFWMQNQAKPLEAIVSSFFEVKSS